MTILCCWCVAVAVAKCAWIFKFAWYFAWNCTRHCLTRGQWQCLTLKWGILFNCLLYHRKTRVKLCWNVYIIIWKSFVYILTVLMEFNTIRLSCDTYLSSEFVISLSSFLLCFSYSFIWFPRERRESVGGWVDKFIYAHILSMSLFSAARLNQ